MTYDEIKAAMAELVKAMLDKDVKNPRAWMSVEGNANGQVTLWSDTYSRKLDGDYLKIIYGETPQDQIVAARAYIAALPDPATEGERLFTRKLAEAVDIATEYALPDAVVAPVKTAIREVNAALLEKK